MIRRRIAEGWCVQISHAEFSEEILHNAARATPFWRFRLKRGVWRSGHTFFQQSLRLLQRRNLHWAHDKSACKEIRSELLQIMYRLSSAPKVTETEDSSQGKYRKGAAKGEGSSIHIVAQKPQVAYATSTEYLPQLVVHFSGLWREVLRGLLLISAHHKLLKTCVDASPPTPWPSPAGFQAKENLGQSRKGRELNPQVVADVAQASSANWPVCPLEVS